MGDSMTALLAIYGSEGLIGRCDAKCYEAVHPVCDCVCGGRNHGAGRTQAVSNTRALAQEWVNAYTRSHSLTDYTTTIETECQHTTLWEGLV